MTFLTGPWTTPYVEDRRLLEELGLPTMYPFPNDDGWQDVGELYRDEWEDGTTVKIEVYCAPAMFFRFTIVRPEWDSDLGCYNGTSTTVLTTGSGTLGDYWPVAERFAENMLVVDSISKDVSA